MTATCQVVAHRPACKAGEPALGQPAPVDLRHVQRNAPRNGHPHHRQRSALSILYTVGRLPAAPEAWCMPHRSLVAGTKAFASYLGNSRGGACWPPTPARALSSTELPNSRHRHFHSGARVWYCSSYLPAGTCSRPWSGEVASPCRRCRPVHPAGPAEWPETVTDTCALLRRATGGRILRPQGPACHARTQPAFLMWPHPSFRAAPCGSQVDQPEFHRRGHPSAGCAVA